MELLSEKKNNKYLNKKRKNWCIKELMNEWVKKRIKWKNEWKNEWMNE